MIEVVPDTGAVYAALLNGDRHNGFSTSFTKSTDHGRTWSAPVHVYGNVSWTDKPEIATSASGKDVYISWNGPEGGDLYVGQSHDYGETWTQQKLSDSKRYYYAYDGRVLADGTVVFAESSLQYSGAKNGARRSLAPRRDLARRRRDVGGPRRREGAGRRELRRRRLQAGLLHRPDVGRLRRSGHLVFAYEGPTTDLGPQRVYVAPRRTPAARGARPRRSRSPAKTRPARGSRRKAGPCGSGTCRPPAATIRTRGTSGTGARPTAGGAGRRRSRSPTRPPERPDYVGPSGFAEVYGDYGEIGVTSAGKTFATWGEGFSYTGPGGTWFNVQR